MALLPNIIVILIYKTKTFESSIDYMKYFVFKNPKIVTASELGVALLAISVFFIFCVIRIRKITVAGTILAIVRKIKIMS